MQARAGAIDELIASGALEGRLPHTARATTSPGARGDELAGRRRGGARRAEVGIDPPPPQAILPAGRRRHRRHRGAEGRRGGHPALTGDRLVRPARIGDMAHAVRRRCWAHRPDDLGHVPARSALRRHHRGADRRDAGRLGADHRRHRLGVVWFQWYKSDTVAMKAMRAARSPRAGSGLRHDRAALHARRHAEAARGHRRHRPAQRLATGRSPNRSVVVVTTGILRRLTAEELEGVLAHELSHVAHRDVLVMTVASSAGIVASMLTAVRSTARSSVGPARQQHRRAYRSGWWCWWSAW